MRAALPIARQIRATQQLSVATALNATREAQALAGNVADLESTASSLEALTAGLDVAAIGFSLADLDTRLSALETP